MVQFDAHTCNRMTVNTAHGWCDSGSPVTHEVLMAEVRYGIVFGDMSEVLHSRINRTLLFITIFCGALSSGSLLTLLGKYTPEMVLPWTIGLFVVSALAESLRRGYDFGAKAKVYASFREQFQELEGRGWSMNQGSLLKELAKLRKNAPPGGGVLAALAYNRACRELGHPDVQMKLDTQAKALSWVVG